MADNIRKKPSTAQETYFQKGEGDQYYRRNQSMMAGSALVRNDPILALMKSLKLRPQRVLEIGCSQGWRLNAIRERHHATCMGIDPSQAALAEGHQRYPTIIFKRGVARKLPIPSGHTFDVVIVHFVLHWVSRPALLQSIAEIDRTVAENGILLIGDFYPDHPTRVPYHHLPGKSIYTYKTDYPSLFESTGLYRRQKQIIYDHATQRPAKRIALSQRCLAAALKKSSTGYYGEETLHRPVAALN